MDLIVLKKKLSAYQTKSGKFTRINNEVLVELLRSWEQWTGTAKQLATELGMTRKQLAPLIGKAKKVMRDGNQATESFKELTGLELPGIVGPVGLNGYIELVWDGQRVIRFSTPQQLAEFLRLVA